MSGRLPLNKKRDNMILAVDPGATGAICAYDSLKSYNIIDTPKLTGIDLKNFKQTFIYQIISQTSQVTHIIFEEQHVQTTDGGDTILSYGQIGGAVLGILQYLFPDAELVNVHPVTWKAYFKLNLKLSKDMPDKEKKKLRKETSCEYLSSILGGEQNWMRGKMGGLKDGRVDSMLIALWGQAYISGSAKLPVKKEKPKKKRISKRVV